jgi:hypothetical protein
VDGGAFEIVSMDGRRIGEARFVRGEKEEVSGLGQR